MKLFTFIISSMAYKIILFSALKLVTAYLLILVLSPQESITTQYFTRKCLSGLSRILGEKLGESLDIIECTEGMGHVALIKCLHLPLFKL